MTTAFDLHTIVEGTDNQTNFTTMLLKLILKADENNKEKLRHGFPNAFETVEHWQRTGAIIHLDMD